MERWSRNHMTWHSAVRCVLLREIKTVAASLCGRNWWDEQKKKYQSFPNHMQPLAFWKQKYFCVPYHASVTHVSAQRWVTLLDSGRLVLFSCQNSNKLSGVIYDAFKCCRLTCSICLVLVFLGNVSSNQKICTCRWGNIQPTSGRARSYF